MSQGETSYGNDLPFPNESDGYLTLGQSAYGWISGTGGEDGDWDLYSVYLEANVNYDFFCTGTSVNGVAGAGHMFLQFYDVDGNVMHGRSPRTDGSVRDSLTVQQSGFYYVAVSGDRPVDVGGYRVSVSTGGSTVDDHGGEFGDAETVSSGAYSGNLERANDVDSFILNGTAGDRYFYTIDAKALDLFNTIDDESNQRLYADTVATSDFIEVKFTETQKFKISFSSNTYTKTGDYSFSIHKAFSLDKDLMVGTAEDTAIIGSDLADEIWGLEGNDSITAGNSEDFLVGSTGNDTLDGGDGSDTAFFFGRRSNYTVTQNTDGSVVITDNHAGRDGQDAVTGVENFRFADATLNLADLLATNNTAPMDLKLSGNTDAVSVREGTAVIGALSGIDNDNDTIQWSFDDTAEGGGNAGGLFVIDNGQIKLATGKTLDYDGANAVRSYTVSIKASDGNSGETKKSFTINVTNANEAPTKLDLSNFSILENAVAGTEVGFFSAVDPDAGETFTYQLTNDAGGRFTIQDGRLVVKDGSRLDREQAKTHLITVKVTDQGGTGLSLEKNFTITVGDVVENEVLIGAKGKDVLQGGDGNDKISGGYGNDSLFGRAGQDVFVFDTKLGTAKTNRKVNFDTINDFTSGQDKIWLDNKIFAKLGKGSEANPGKLNSKFFSIDKAKAKDDYLIYSKKTGVLSYDADGSGSKAAIDIAQLSKNLKLSYKDFLIV